MNILWSSEGSVLASLQKSLTRALLSAFLLLCAFRSPAAPGGLDHSFNPAYGVNGAVSSIIPQMDGRILIAGEFTTVRNGVRNRIARIN
ncbi:MAG: delta-60 repeat domain-containing protein, partial [Limisphaerales bacterium]